MLRDCFSAFDSIVLSVLLCLGTPLLRLFHALLDALGVPGAPAGIEDDIVLWFDSSGLLLPYHIGVADYIAENYDVSRVVAAGISGGYAPASTLVLGVNTESHWEAIQTLRALGASRWLGCYFFSSDEMIEHGYLPQLEADEPNALAKLAGGRMHLGCSELLPRLGRAVWINRFESARAICYACTCSMRTLPILRIPGLIGRALVIDGVLACRPARAAHKLIRVSVFPSKRATISPAGHLGGMSDLVRLPSRANFERWLAQGRADAADADARGVFAAAGLVALPQPPPRARQPGISSASDAAPRQRRARRSPARR